MVEGVAWRLGLIPIWPEGRGRPLRGLFLIKYITNEVNKMLRGSIRYMGRETDIYSETKAKTT